MGFRIITKARYIDNIDDCNALLFNLISSGKKNKLSLCIEGKGKEQDALKAWKKINHEFVAEFGYSRVYKEFLRNILKVEKIRYAIEVEGKKSKRAILEVEEKKIEEFLNRKPETVNQTAIRLTKEYQTRINPADCSVREFYTYLNPSKDG